METRRRPRRSSRRSSNRRRTSPHLLQRYRCISSPKSRPHKRRSVITIPNLRPKSRPSRQARRTSNPQSRRVFPHLPTKLRRKFAKRKLRRNRPPRPHEILPKNGQAARRRKNPKRRRSPTTLKNKCLLSPAFPRASQRRRHLHQRLQFPSLGPLRKSRPSVTSRRPHSSKASLPHRLANPQNGRRHNQIRHPTRRRHLHPRRLSPRPTRSRPRRRHRLLHRLRRHRRQNSFQSKCPKPLSPSKYRSRQHQLRDPRPRRHARDRPIRSIRKRSSSRNDPKSRTKMHRHPPRAGPPPPNEAARRSNLSSSSRHKGRQSKKRRSKNGPGSK